MSQSSRRPALGRGLSALIPGADEAPRSQPTVDEARSPSVLPIGRVRPSRDQPRTVFDERRLDELADSVREKGVLQPIVVREADVGDYVIIAGERRYRAARRVGLTEVPVVVRDTTDDEAYELALIENIQREDLDPIEEALAYRHLMEAQTLTQAEVARRVGKDRATVANSLRLLKLPEEIRDTLAAGELSAGHARALLTAPEERRLVLAHEAIAQGWSVRETERQAREARDPSPEAEAHEIEEQPTSAADAAEKRDERSDPASQAVEDQLRAALGAPVRLKQRRGKGRIEIRFHSLEELERLIDMLAGLEGY